MIVELLLIVLIFTIQSIALIGFLYFLVILPMHKRLESSIEKVVAKHPQKQEPFFSARRPEGLLPDLDDIPLDALFGGNEEEDYTTRPEDLEDALTQRSHNTYNSSQKDAFQQLKGLNPDAA